MNVFPLIDYASSSSCVLISLALPLLQVKSLLSNHSVRVLKVPVDNPADDLSDGKVETKLLILNPLIFLIEVSFVGGKLPFEAIFVPYKDSSHSPTVVILHGGPHSISVSSYSRSSAFLASLGFNLLTVNYRYVLGIALH
jgi:acylaminoacyl-peptidase